MFTPDVPNLLNLSAEEADVDRVAVYDLDGDCGVGVGEADEGVKVICAWCQAEGRPGLVREKDPLDDTNETHGVCLEHKRRFMTPTADQSDAGRDDAPDTR